MNFNGTYEEQYMSALNEIYVNGYSDGVNERTGVSTKRLPGIVFRVDLKEEFPILKSKKVFAKTALREILWIWQSQSNNIKDLKAHIWDEWADENGTIGKAYGYQVAKPVDVYLDPVKKTPESFRHYDNQAQYVLELLRECPNSRWANVTLWNASELKDMNLVPCCHTVTWNLDGGRLNCVLDQRSGDMPYGVPFNTTQYAMLTMLFARDLGVEPGVLTHVIADAHIYDRQMPGVELQIGYWNIIESIRGRNAFNTVMLIEGLYRKFGHVMPYDSASEISDAAIAVFNSEAPTFTVDSDETDFFKVSVDDCSISNYVNMGAIDFGGVVV